MGHHQTAKCKPNQNLKRQEKKKKEAADRKCEEINDENFQNLIKILIYTSKKYKIFCAG